MPYLENREERTEIINLIKENTNLLQQKQIILLLINTYHELPYSTKLITLEFLQSYDKESLASIIENDEEKEIYYSLLLTVFKEMTDEYEEEEENKTIFKQLENIVNKEDFIDWLLAHEEEEESLGIIIDFLKQE